MSDDVDIDVDDFQFPSKKLGAELRQLKETGVAYSAEFMVEGSQPAESSMKAEQAEAEQVPAAAGAFIGGRNTLVGTAEVEVLVGELGRMLAAEQTTEDARPRLLELWTLVEPCLVAGEIEQLRPAVLTQLFGEREAQISLSRGGQQQGGRY